MTKKVKIISALALLASCVGVTVGATYALFSSSKTINNHIKAGALNVGFYLTELKYDVLSNDGMINSHTEDLSLWTGYSVQKEAVDLKVYADAVINVDKFVPTMSGYAMFEVANPGDVAFAYSLDIINKVAELEDGTDVSDDFDDVMTITIEGTQTTPVAVVSSVTTNKINFVFNEDAGNEWQKALFSFDVQLVATQVTATV